MVSGSDAMSLSTFHSYLAYDEQALITFANAGLFRRAIKDVDAGKIQLIEQQPQQLLLQSDGQQVILTPAGLHQAQCDCSAVGACKHILASVLFLQQYLTQTTTTATSQKTPQNELTSSQTSELSTSSSDLSTSDELSNVSTVETSSSTISSTVSTTSNAIIDEILAIDLQKIAKKFGKARAEKTTQFARDYQTLLEQNQGDTRIDVEEFRINIDLLHQAHTITYIIGVGFDGMLSNIDNEQSIWHWLALREVQRKFGQTDIDTSTTPTAIAIERLTPSAIAVIDEVDDALRQMLYLGISHLDELASRRFHLLNISARTEQLPRLATLCRQLGGLIYQFCQQANHVNEGQLLSMMTAISHYLYRLKRAEGEQLIALKGQLRRKYEYDEQIPQLSLLPLGVKWWTAQSGARGLTLYFCQSDDDMLDAVRSPVTVTLARADHLDYSFNQMSAWQQSLWRYTPQKLMYQAFQLKSPRFNENGQFAVTGSEAVLSEQSTMPLAQLAEYAEHDWQQLQQRWQQQLQEQATIASTVLLRPHISQPITVDEIAQCIWWTVLDQHGHQLRLRLDWTERHQHKITQLERINYQEIQWIFAEVRLKEQHVELEPMSCYVDKLGIVHLDYDSLPKAKKAKEDVSGRILKLFEKKQAFTQHHQPKTAIQQLCLDILSRCETLSSIGKLQLNAETIQYLQQQQQLAQDVGLMLLADCIAQSLQAISLEQQVNQLFKLTYLCELVLTMQVRMPIILNDGNDD